MSIQSWSTVLLTIPIDLEVKIRQQWNASFNGSDQVSRGVNISRQHALHVANAASILRPFWWRSLFFVENTTMYNEHYIQQCILNKLINGIGYCLFYIIKLFTFTAVNTKYDGLAPRAERSNIHRAHRIYRGKSKIIVLLHEFRETSVWGTHTWHMSHQSQRKVTDVVRYKQNLARN